ncbi:NUDIX domain-containing protein [Spirosoma endbachense]|uniref:NUDIX domain-containing protein n=1 Tax=Spirosoma endbachense TaxID=2666025 RepID=UPI0018E06D6F|nr:NUDIX domain-containing protein [Spirosoma endbachense]
MEKPSQLILPAVAAIIFDQQGRILLQKRRDVNQWGLLGGHVEFGETVEQAIYREISEETDAQVRIDRLIGVYSEPASQTYIYPNRIVQYVTTYFKGELLSELNEGFANEETQALRLFRVDALPDELARLHPFWLDDALATSTSAYMR